MRFPVEHPDEMGATLEHGVARLSRHDSYVRAFAEAFPQDRQISPDNIAKALAAYERTLVSPPTRFDQWIAGDAAALTPSEVNGFAIFTGKGRCINCHTGFAFTDHGFYDIGLPSEDAGRGPIVGLPVADHAFKMPTLRELAWTAPYMHDGSLGTLDDVVRVYEMGGVERPTRSKDLPETCGSPTRSAPTSSPSSRACRARRRRNPRPSRGSNAAPTRAAAAATRHHRRQPEQQAVLAARTSASRPAGRSPSSTTTRAPTTCASSTRASISTPAPRSRTRR